MVLEEKGQVAGTAEAIAAIALAKAEVTSGLGWSPRSSTHGYVLNASRYERYEFQ